MSVIIDIDSGGVTLPKANDLRFVRTDSRSGYKQNKDEYLLSELIYPIFNYKLVEKQKYNIADSILNQIITRYTIKSVELYNADTDVLVSDLTSDLLLINSVNTDAYGTVRYYNHTIDTTTLFGNYYVILTINTSQTYKSESFQVKGLTDSDGVYIKYYNEIDSKSIDGIYYNGSMEFNFWLPASIYEPNFGEERTMFNSFNYVPEILQGIAQRYEMLEYGTVPWFISEKLNLAIQHDHFIVNGIEYKARQAIRDEAIKNYPLGTFFHRGSVLIQPQDYGNYTSIVAAEAEAQNNIIWGDSSDDLLWGDSSGQIIVYEDE